MIQKIIHKNFIAFSLIAGVQLCQSVFAATELAAISSFDGADVNVMQVAIKYDDFAGEYLEAIYRGGQRVFFVDDEILYAISDGNDCEISDDGCEYKLLPRPIPNEQPKTKDLLIRPDPPVKPEPKEPKEPKLVPLKK